MADEEKSKDQAQELLGESRITPSNYQDEPPAYPGPPPAYPGPPILRYQEYQVLQGPIILVGHYPPQVASFPGASHSQPNTAHVPEFPVKGKHGSETDSVVSNVRYFAPGYGSRSSTPTVGDNQQTQQ